MLYPMVMCGYKVWVSKEYLIMGGQPTSGYPKILRKPGMLWNPATAAASLE